MASAFVIPTNVHFRSAFHHTPLTCRAVRPRRLLVLCSAEQEPLQDPPPLPDPTNLQPPPPRPTPPPPTTPPSASSNPTPPPADQEALDERLLRKPDVDPTPLRSTSERRRMLPVRELRRERRPRRRSRTTPASALDWKNLPRRPLVSEDSWVDVQDAVRAEEAKERKEARRGVDMGIEDGLRDKLKGEVVSPYKNNWILGIMLGVVALAVLYKVLPSDGPIIPIPDL